jgi:hypothetical protein
MHAGQALLRPFAHFRPGHALQADGRPQVAETRQMKLGPEVTSDTDGKANEAAKALVEMFSGPPDPHLGSPAGSICNTTSSSSTTGPSASSGMHSRSRWTKCSPRSWWNCSGWSLRKTLKCRAGGFDAVAEALHFGHAAKSLVDWNGTQGNGTS